MEKTSAPSHTHLQSRMPADRVIADYLLRHFASEARPLLIAVGGPGGSGKTTFAEKLHRRCADSGIIHLDNYKTSRSEREKRRLPGPHPDANRMELVRKHLTAVKSGRKVQLPIYDSVSGDTGSFKEYPPRRFNIIEGEISTYREFRPLVDLSIFIDADFKTQLAARTGRDVSELGHTLQKAVSTFLTSNLTAYTIYGAESKQWADIHLFCHEDYHFSMESVRSELFVLFHQLMHDATPVEPTGLIVPVTTPFESDLSICQSAYIDHLSWLSGKGVTRLIVGGTTAEFFSLTIAERLTLLKLGREYFPGFIIFNISADSITTTVEMAKRAHRYGADALLCLPPSYYAGAPPSGLIAYFSAVASACELPLYLYNFPEHTGNPITGEILQNVPHAGLKDSAADLSLITRTPHYLLGGDALIVEACRQGACGYVPGLPNVFPEIYLDLEKLLDEKAYERAEVLQLKINAFKRSLPHGAHIVTIKKYLNRIVDSYPAAVRPPLDGSSGEAVNLSPMLI
jgi:dihydrodipicolinate synthase/N-acetylneuraminate lyase/uridine kinase